MQVENTIPAAENQVHYAPQRWPMPQAYAEQSLYAGDGKHFSVLTHCNGQELTPECIAYLKLLLRNTEITLGKIDWSIVFPEPSHVERPVKSQRRTNIYLMLNRRNNHWKIGHSSNPAYRERTLQSEEPEIELICYFSGTIRDEEILHDRYKSKRLRGEWFALSDQEVAEIKHYMAGS